MSNSAGTRSITLWLPWPPSVNHYWMTSGKRRFIGKDGKAFREAVLLAFLQAREQGFGRGRVSVAVVAYPADRRRRDLDNILKAILDALEAARVFDDDAQADRLQVERGEIRPKDAGVLVTITGH